VYALGDVYVCVTVAPDPEAPSPKVHEYVYGEMPPDAEAENVTARGTFPELGLAIAFTEGSE